MNCFLECTVDLAFHIHSITSLTMAPSRKLFFTLEVGSQANPAGPYMIIPGKIPSKSSAGIIQYQSAVFDLGPLKTIPIGEIVVFKLHVPMAQIQKEELSYRFTLKSIQTSLNSYSSNAPQIEQLQQFTINHTSLLSLHTFIPILFRSQHCSISAVLHSQLLSLKTNKIQTTLRAVLYKGIDQLIRGFNKLSQRVQLPTTQEQKSIIMDLSISRIEMKEKLAKSDQQFEQSQLSMDEYPQYRQIKEFYQHKIFNPAPLSYQRSVLNHFCSTFFPDMNIKLQHLWSIFLSQALQTDKIEEYRKQFVHAFSMDTRMKISTAILDNIKRMPIQVNGGQVRCVNTIKMSSPSIKLFTLASSHNSSFVGLNKSCVPYSLPSTFECTHVVVLVHGFGATSLSMLTMEITLKYLYPHIIILNSRINQDNTDDSLFQMGQRLATQILTFLSSIKVNANFKLSFIGHSLGGLIIRASLRHLQQLKYNMHAYISLASPHLGYFYHNSKLNKLGMWMIEKWTGSTTLRMLLMKDTDMDKQEVHIKYRKYANNQEQLQYPLERQTGVRSSELYRLSQLEGFGWFQDVVLYGCQQDKFVASLSALIQSNQQILKDAESNTFKVGSDHPSVIWQEMRNSINTALSKTRITKNVVRFNSLITEPGSLSEQMLGRRPHVAMTGEGQFINAMLLSNYKLFD